MCSRARGLAQNGQASFKSEINNFFSYRGETSRPAHVVLVQSRRHLSLRFKSSPCSPSCSARAKRKTAARVIETRPISRGDANPADYFLGHAYVHKPVRIARLRTRRSVAQDKSLPLTRDARYLTRPRGIARCPHTCAYFTNRRAGGRVRGVSSICQWCRGVQRDQSSRARQSFAWRIQRERRGGTLETTDVHQVICCERETMPRHLTPWHYR